MPLERVQAEGQVLQRVRGRASTVLTSLASELSDDMKAVHRSGSPGTGKIYHTYFFTDSQGRVRPWGKRIPPHRASAPGHPPAIDQGGLLRSIGWSAPNEMTREVGAGMNVSERPASLGLWLERGTHRNGRVFMKPRPFMKPAVRELKARHA